MGLHGPVGLLGVAALKFLCHITERRITSNVVLVDLALDAQIIMAGPKQRFISPCIFTTDNDSSQAHT